MTPTKPTGNDGASQVESDAEDQENESEEENELAPKKEEASTPRSEILVARCCQAPGHWREGSAR